METAFIWIVGLAVAAIAWAWLMILPFRLVRGLLHKWGLHTYCGRACEQFLSAERVQTALHDEFRKGLRQGMRGAITFGPAESHKMLEDMTLLPWWAVETNTGEDFKTRVGAKCSELAFLTDAQDPADEWATAYAVSLGRLLTNEAADIVDEYLDVVRRASQPTTDAQPA